MRRQTIILVGAKCVACDPHGNGARAGTFFGKTYDLPRWKRKPKCVNCKGRMTKLLETRVPVEAES